MSEEIIQVGTTLGAHGPYLSKLGFPPEVLDGTFIVRDIEQTDYNVFYHIQPVGEVASEVLDPEHCYVVHSTPDHDLFDFVEILSQPEAPSDD